MSAIALPVPIAPPPTPPSTPGMTVEEFVARYNGRPFELVKGIVKEVPVAGLEHGQVCARITMRLGVFVEANDLGRIMCNDSFVRTGERSVRGADVLFYSYERLPREQATPSGLHDQPPELVVEVKSPTDRWIDLLGKAVEYIQAGVRVVVLVEPVKRNVSIYRDEEQTILYEGDELTLPDVLPGFSLPVDRLFA